MTLKVDNIQTTAGVTLYSCKAFLNYDQVGTTTIFSKDNIATWTDAGTGLANVTFTVNLPDTNYCVVVTSGVSAVTTPVAGSTRLGMVGNMATTGFTILIGDNSTDAATDNANVSVAVFR